MKRYLVLTCTAAAIFLATWEQSAEAAASPVNANLARAAQETALHRAAAIPMATPGFDGQDNFAQRVVWASLIRRLIIRLRSQALPAGVAAGLEEAAKALEKRFPRERLRQEVCLSLDSLRGLALDSRIKPDARATLFELAAELKQVAGCRSPQAAQR